MSGHVMSGQARSGHDKVKSVQVRTYIRSGQGQVMSSLVRARSGELQSGVVISGQVR